MVELISKGLKSNKEQVKSLFNNTSDLVIYEFETKSNLKLMVCYIEGFIDRDLLDRDIIKPMILNLDRDKDINKFFVCIWTRGGI